MLQITPCLTAQDYASALEITRAYTDWLGLDLGFQGIEHERENFARIYGRPRGFYLLARQQSVLAGGVGLRPLVWDNGARIAEMKRLFVYEQFKGQGIGEQLCRALKNRARHIGYQTIRLDTLPRMAAAHSLYRKSGFYEIPPYCYNPLPGAVFMECMVGVETGGDAVTPIDVALGPDR